METLKELPAVKRTGRKPKYNFSKEIGDGKAHRLIRGSKKEVEAGDADFNCTTTTMRHNLYRIGRNNGVNLSTVIEVDDKGRETISFQKK